MDKNANKIRNIFNLETIVPKTPDKINMREIEKHEKQFSVNHLDELYSEKFITFIEKMGLYFSVFYIDLLSHMIFIIIPIQ